MVWPGCLCPLPSPATWGGGRGWKETGPDLSLHSQRENRTDERRQGKHQLFSTITRVQGVGHIPDMLELWVENVTALKRPFSQLPCYRAINLHVERSGLGRANETHLPVTGGRRKYAVIAQIPEDDTDERACDQVKVLHAP